MTTLILVRHGETDNNLIPACLNGVRCDQPLNATGEAQAAALGRHLKDIPFDVAFASTMLRAQQTAKAALGGRDIPITPRRELCELDFGAWDGISLYEVDKMHPGTLNTWRTAPHTIEFPGGEMLSEGQARMAAAVAAIVQENRGKSILVVSHQLALTLFFLSLLHLPTSRKPDIRGFSNTAFARLLIEDDGSVRVTHWNCYEHLNAPKKSLAVIDAPQFLDQIHHYPAFAR